MSDPQAPPPPPSPEPGAIRLPPPEPPSRGLAIFWVVSGSIVLVLTLGCILAVGGGNSEDLTLGVLCGSPTLILGAVLLWVGTRRLKRTK